MAFSDTVGKGDRNHLTNMTEREMKINQVGSGGQVPGEGPGKKEKVQNSSFQSELQKVLDSGNSPSSSKTSSTPSPADVDRSSGISFNRMDSVTDAQPGTPRDSVLNLTGGLLDDLDNFRLTIGNSQLPLVRAKDLMERINIQKDSLLERMPDLDDEDLKSIVKDAVLLVNEESARYFRNYQM